MYSPQFELFRDFSDRFLVKFRDLHFGSGKLSLPKFQLNHLPANYISHLEVKLSAFQDSPDLILSRTAEEFEKHLLSRGNILCYCTVKFDKHRPFIERQIQDQQQKVSLKFVLETLDTVRILVYLHEDV